MDHVGIFGLGLLTFGLVGAVVGWFYMLLTMLWERDWWYFFPSLFATCIVVGLIIISIVANIKS